MQDGYMAARRNVNGLLEEAVGGLLTNPERSHESSVEEE